MIFLNPAVLLGLIASSIPILIHLLNLRKLKRIEFSTLAFLKELQKTKIRRIKLKQWILMILRVLIIMFLVMAFARPALKSVSFGMSAGAKTTGVIIIDNSFSMSAVNERGSLLNQTKLLAKQILDEYSEGDELAVLDFSSLNEPLAAVTKSVIAEEMIDGIDFTYLAGDIYELIVKALPVLNNSQNYNKELYILSDLQQSGFLLTNDTTRIPVFRSMKIYIAPIVKENINNLSAANLVSNNQIFELNKNITFSADIFNPSSYNISNSVVSLYVNGKRSAQSSVNITPGETIQTEFETVIQSTGLIDIFVELEDDDINFDNRHYLNIYVPEKINILLLTDIKSDAEYVSTALQSVSEDYFKVTEDMANRLNSYNISSYNVVILIGSSYHSNSEKVKTYLESGGSVILFPGSSSDNTDFNRICRELNLPQAERIVTFDDPQSFSSFEGTDLNHPVFSDLFESGKREYESPRLYKYYKTESSGKGRSIISLIDGSEFLSEYNYKAGKIFLFNTSPVLSWSDFPLKGIFAPMLSKSVYYLLNSNKPNKNYIAGADLMINAGNVVRPDIKVIRPDNTEEYINPDISGFNNTFSYSPADFIGTYKFYSGNKLFDYATVNFNPIESQTKYLGFSEAEEKITPLSQDTEIIELKPGENVAATISSARFGTELWKYFLIIVLLLALIEMWVAKNTKKDLSEITN
ncbi:MAG: BatA and WFA domain-containing protein [Melioribacteraceae bacterium]|nr:BatA and WFA domain-containing protein [Melioribacteraceae bacterium]